MSRWFAWFVLSLSLATATGLAGSNADPEQAPRAAAVAFGEALIGADAARLKSLLPARGKVRLRLSCFGPEEGVYGPGQVEALLRDFLRNGSVQTFEVVRVEADAQRFAVVHGRAGVIDRQGRPTRLEVHLSLQPEDGRWVLREIREKAP